MFLCVFQCVNVKQWAGYCDPLLARLLTRYWERTCAWSNVRVCLHESARLADEECDCDLAWCVEVISACTKCNQIKDPTLNTKWMTSTCFHESWTCPVETQWSSGSQGVACRNVETSSKVRELCTVPSDDVKVPWLLSWSIDGSGLWMLYFLLKTLYYNSTNPEVLRHGLKVFWTVCRLREYTWIWRGSHLNNFVSNNSDVQSG